MTTSASICMPSMTARKSSWRRPKRCTAASRTRVTGPSDWPRYSPATRSRHAASRGSLSANALVFVHDVIDDAAERVDRIHRVPAIRRQHAHAAVERGAGGADDRLDRVEVGLRRVERGHAERPLPHPLPQGEGECCNALPLPLREGAGGRGPAPSWQMPQRHQPARNDIALAELHPPRQRITPAQPSRQPMREADNDRSLQSQPATSRAARQIDRRRVQPVHMIEQHDRTRAAGLPLLAWPRRSSTDAPQRSSRSNGR